MSLSFFSSSSEPSAEVRSGKPARMSTALAALAGLFTLALNPLEPLSILDSVFASFIKVTGLHLNREVSAALCLTGGLVLLCLSLAFVLLRWYHLQLRLTEMLPPSLADASYDGDEVDGSDCTTVNLEQAIPQHQADALNSEPGSSTFIVKKEEHDDAVDLAQLQFASKSQSSDWDYDLLPPSDVWDHALFDDESADDEQIVFQLLSRRMRPSRRKGESWTGKGKVSRPRSALEGMGLHEAHIFPRSQRYRDVKTNVSRDEALWQPGRVESMGAARQLHRAFNAALPSGRVPGSRR
ncbi:hypothetical protein TRAPUB_2720 [Trametes pubescens]|uniref:Uncharacterized protein n=1 Tax=Trametes pubescens TaxID=154538 RepID=A0A1M2VFS7_TRAPU|nr:hypothetical protein TRAPUB_2720 [Trametes pubescens]